LVKDQLDVESVNMSRYMCVFMFVSALYNRMSYSITEVGNLHN